MANVITDNLDVWTSAIKPKAIAGRGRGGKLELYGIKKLRELILELAVRGLLVEQDASEEPASVLLEKIAKEKAKLVKEKKIKKQKALAPVGDDEKPFELPEGWEWVRLPDVCHYMPGKTPSTKNPVYWSDDENGVPWVSISDMEHFGRITETTKRVTKEASEKVFSYEPIPAGSLLMSFKLTVGKISKLDIDAYHNEAIISINPFSGIDENFLFNVLPMRAQKGNTKRAIMGNTLNATSLSMLMIPLPPYSEQTRIVNKVNELMTLCDHLEQQTEESLSAHNTLVETLLAALTNAPDHAGFSEAWQRIAEHFDILFTTEQSIDQLQQTILQLAVMGKLVAQDPNDEPASVLLEKIAAEKAKLIKEKKIKKQKSLPPIGDEEKPFELPEGWEWTRFGNILEGLKYGTSKRCDYGVDGDPVLRIPNTVKGYIDSTDLKFTVLDEKEKKELALKSGDILIIRSNGSLSIVGRSAVVDETHKNYMYAGYLVRARINTDLYSSLLLKIILDSILIREQIEFPIRTTSGVKNINSTEISNLLIPVIPLNEQHRITKKVEELTTLCTQLKSRLTEAQTTQLKLADAITDQAIAS